MDRSSILQDELDIDLAKETDPEIPVKASSPRSWVLLWAMGLALVSLTGCNPEAKFQHWSESFLHVFQDYPFSSIFLGLFICGLGIPMPEEFFLIMAGYICFAGGHHWYVMAAVTMVAILGGDSVTYFMGRTLRDRIFELPLIHQVLGSKGRRKATDFLARHGNKTIFFARFMPGIRMPTYLTCGVLGVPYSVFLLHDGMAATISVPIQVYLSWKFGFELEDAIRRVIKFNRAAFIGFLGIAMALYLYSHFRDNWMNDGEPKPSGPDDRSSDSGRFPL